MSEEYKTLGSGKPLDDKGGGDHHTALVCALSRLAEAGGLFGKNSQGCLFAENHTNLSNVSITGGEPYWNWKTSVNFPQDWFWGDQSRSKTRQEESPSGAASTRGLSFPNTPQRKEEIEYRLRDDWGPPGETYKSEKGLCGFLKGAPTEAVHNTCYGKETRSEP